MAENVLFKRFLVTYYYKKLKISSSILEILKKFFYKRNKSGEKLMLEKKTKCKLKKCTSALLS